MLQFTKFMFIVHTFYFFVLHFDKHCSVSRPWVGGFPIGLQFRCPFGPVHSELRQILVNKYLCPHVLYVLNVLVFVLARVLGNIFLTFQQFHFIVVRDKFGDNHTMPFDILVTRRLLPRANLWISAQCCVPKLIRTLTDLCFPHFLHQPHKFSLRYVYRTFLTVPLYFPIHSLFRSHFLSRSDTLASRSLIFCVFLVYDVF